MPFSAKPATTSAEREWAEHAPVNGAAATAAASTQTSDLDPKARPSKAFNMRLNDYELELLREAAAAEFCSQQAIAKRILVRALEEAATARKR